MSVSVDALLKSTVGKHAAEIHSSESIHSGASQLSDAHSLSTPRQSTNTRPAIASAAVDSRWIRITCSDDA